jgi:L-gulonolactone oxidase
MTALRLLNHHRASRRRHKVRVCYANSVEDIQSEVSRCSEDGERLRPIGGRASITALTESDENLLSLEHLRGAELAQIERRRMWVRPGTPLDDLNGWLARHDLGLNVTPDYPGQTVGAAISTGSPAALADYVLGLRIVHADGHRTSYSRERDHGLFDAVRVSLGAMGVITQIELRCDERRPGCLRRRPLSFSDALSVLEADDALTAGQVVTWFANAPAQVEYWDLHAEPSLPDLLVEQARGLVHDAIGLPLLASLAGSLQAGPRWSDALGSELIGPTSGGPLPLSRLRTVPRVAYAIPASGAVEFLLRLRDLWRSQRFPVYAPVRIEFAAASGAWLSPMYERDSALVSFPSFGANSKHFVDAICSLLEASAGRPCWSQLRHGAPPPTSAAYPRLPDFAALRGKVDRRGVFVNPYLSALFGLTER